MSKDAKDSILVVPRDESAYDYGYKTQPSDLASAQRLGETPSAPEDYRPQRVERLPISRSTLLTLVLLLGVAGLLTAVLLSDIDLGSQQLSLRADEAPPPKLVVDSLAADDGRGLGQSVSGVAVPEAGDERFAFAEGESNIDGRIAPCLYGPELVSTGECVGRLNHKQIRVNGIDQETMTHRVENQDHPWCEVRDGRCFIENKRIFGCLSIRTAGVVVRNNYIQCYSSRDLAGSNSGYNGAVSVSSIATGALIENNEIACKIKESDPDQAPCDAGVIARGGEIRRNVIVGAVDGVDPSDSDGVVVEANYIHDFSIVWEGWRNDMSHADGIQVEGSTGPAFNLVLRNNVIVAPTAPSQSAQLQGIFAKGNSEIVVDGNVLVGVFESAHRITCMRGARCTVRNNVIDVAHKGEAISIEDGTIEPNNRLSDGQPIN